MGVNKGGGTRRERGVGKRGKQRKKKKSPFHHLLITARVRHEAQDYE